MGCHRATSLPLLSVDVNGCDKKPANPCIETSVITQNGRPSYCGVCSRGSSDSKHFNVTNAFCCSALHLSLSEADASALLYAPFLAFPGLLGFSTLIS